MSVANFAPELLQLYKRARRESVSVRLPSRNEATKLRHRLYQLRKDMRKEQHPDTLLAEGVSFSIHTEGEFTYLTGSPADNSYVDAIRAAGVSATDTDPEPNAETEPVPAHSQTATERAIAEMFTPKPTEED